MWQRFTERARRIIFFAQEEAVRLGENYISTEHLLLGLLRENDTVAARILNILGIPPDSVRTEVERQLVHGRQQVGPDVQLTPRAKRVIDLAYNEARELDNNYIGTEHLLLGLIREGEGLAGRVFIKMGVELDATRDAVRMLQDSEPGLEPTSQTSRPPSPPPSSVLQAATAINAYTYGVDSGNWPLAVRYFADKVEVDFSAIKGIKGRLLRADLQQELQQRLSKPDLRVHTLIEQLLTDPEDTSQFIAYYTARYFKGQLGVAAKFEILGWFTYRMEGDYIVALTAYVSALEGNPALFS